MKFSGGTASNGGLYRSTTDGKVHCFGKQRRDYVGHRVMEPLLLVRQMPVAEPLRA